MKKLLATLLVLLPAVAFAQMSEPSTSELEIAEAGKAARIRFIKSEHNFGQIRQGAKVTYTFRFKNIGDAALRISNVKTTCGCTVSSWSREDVPPGEYGTIKATFDSKDKLGEQQKVITVFTNAIDPKTVIKIIAEVVEED